MTLGRLETRRADVKHVIAIRFGSEMAEEIQAVLDGISDLERLAELLELAIRCRRISDFRRDLKAHVTQH